MKPITFITGNKHKLKQVNKHLNYPIEHVDIDLAEIQSLDPLKIVEHKAKEAFLKVQKPVLVEDTSLIFHALGKLPGPFIKWFLDELGPEGLCTLMQPYTDKSATAWVLFAYYDGSTLEVFDIQQKGIITDNPRGENGFGWNSIFIPDGETKTFAEMDEEEQKNTSLRKRALIKLETYLQQHGQ